MLESLVEEKYWNGLTHTGLSVQGWPEPETKPRLRLYVFGYKSNFLRTAKDLKKKV